MFSKEFMQMLASVQYDTSAENLAAVLRGLLREAERLERSVIIQHDEITLKTGVASMVLKADGSVLISGREIAVDSSNRITVKADGDLVLKGSRVVTN